MAKVIDRGGDVTEDRGMQWVHGQIDSDQYFSEALADAKRLVEQGNAARRRRFILRRLNQSRHR